MTKFVTKRDYLLIVIFIIHIFVFIFLKLGIELNIEILISRKEYYLDIKDWTNVSILSKKILTVVRMYTFLLTISLLIILLLINNKYKPFSNKPSKLFEKVSLFFIIWFVYVSLSYGNSFAMALHGYGGFSEGNLDNDYLLTYFQFIPYLIIIFNYSIMGEQKDISNVIIKKSEFDFGNSLAELNKLSSSGIISIEEFESKKNQLIRIKAKRAIELSEDYQILESLKNKGVLKLEEFEQKVELLIIKKIKETEIKKANNSS